MKTIILLVVLVCLFLFAVDADAERHTPTPFKTGRSVVIAPNGMVATSHPLAAQIGLDVLKKGGNAVDAAIAVNAALGLMEPMSCGIGGDLFAIVWDSKTKKLYGLDASGRSPYKATREFFMQKRLKEIPVKGPLSLSVPGCVDGWEMLRKKFGTMTFEQILGSTIEYGEKGFPVTEVIAGYWRGAEKTLAETPEATSTYLLPNGKAPGHGDVFKNPRLAKSYREIAEKGRDAFYKGRLAKELVSSVEKQGGLFTMKDMEDHFSTWVEPAGTNYRGYDVWQIPPPGQGIAVLQMLNILEGYDLKKMGPTSPDYWHLFAEAKKLAYADRARFYADPAFVKLPLPEIISKPYADKRRKLISMDTALKDVPSGDPKLGKSDTVYLTVVDKDRNCCSLIQSNYFGFGSGLVAGELGFALQNRGTLFSLDPDHLNRLEPHKRPFHTIIPSFVTKDGKPFLCFGVMGGDMQPQGQVQVLVNMIDFNMDVQQAGEAPRVEHIGSATPTGSPGSKDGGTVRAERGISDKIIAELRKRGHKVGIVSRNGGGYQGILIDPKTGMLHGGSEARKDGCAVGY